jgi:hypothetical protein
LKEKRKKERKKERINEMIEFTNAISLSFDIID